MVHSLFCKVQDNDNSNPQQTLSLEPYPNTVKYVFQYPIQLHESMYFSIQYNYMKVVDYGALTSSFFVRVFEQFIKEKLLIHQETSHYYHVHEDNNSEYYYTMDILSNESYNWNDYSLYNPKKSKQLQDLLLMKHVEQLDLYYNNTILITDVNKKWYVQQIIKEELIESKRSNLEQLKQGFVLIMQDLCQGLSYQDLSLLFSGQQYQLIDASYLYHHCFYFIDANNEIQECIQHVVKELSQTELKKLLLFVTGTVQMYSLTNICQLKSKVTISIR